MSYYNSAGKIIEIKNELPDKTKTYQTYTKKECHSGTIEVFKDPKTNISICGGGEYRGVKVTPKDLLIDVGIKLDNLVEITNVENADKLKEYGTYKIIKIAWKDMSDVNLPVEFWEELVNVIRTTNRKTIISCVGGHGRTGTALSILTYLMLENKNPIEFVRKNYCDEAVETMDQIMYIEKICNLKLEDEPSKYYYTSCYSGYGASLYEEYTKKGGDASVTEKEEKEEKVEKVSLDFENLYPAGLFEDDDVFITEPF